MIQTTILQENYPFLIMAHRGFWGGNIIQNTRQAAQVAVKAGADIVEVDVCRSSDGIYYLFHNGNENALLGLEEDFNNLNSQVIDSISLINSVGSPSGYRVEHLDAFLDWLPQNYLVNLDRSWFYWKDDHFFELLEKSGKLSQLIIKSPVQEDYLQALDQRHLDLKYIPIIYKQEDWAVVSQYKQIHLVGAEIIVDALDDHGLLDEQWIQELIDQNLLIIANSEHLGETFALFDQLNDSQAILDNELIWKQMKDYGVNVIQTDWPNFLKEYRHSLVNVN